MKIFFTSIPTYKAKLSVSVEATVSCVFVEQTRAAHARPVHTAQEDLKQYANRVNEMNGQKEKVVLQRRKNVLIWSQQSATPVKVIQDKQQHS
jgi:hypothetical protein